MESLGNGDSGTRFRSSSRGGIESASGGLDRFLETVPSKISLMKRRGSYALAAI
jgi:hypothetical protein